jgi:HEAT repeat protein
VIFVLLLALQDIDSILRDFKNDDSTVRDRAVQSAIGRAAEWSAKDLEALRAASAAGDRDLAIRAKETLERIEIRRKLGPALFDRCRTLDDLIRHGDSKACVAFVDTVNTAVYQGTARMADLDALVEVMAAYDVDFEADIFRLTAGTPYPPYARVLRRIVRNPQSRIRADAIVCLARVGGKAEIPLIVPFLKSESAELRAYAVRSFQEYRDRAAMEPIVALLKDPDSDVRRSVLVTLAGLPARDCIPAIVPLLKDEDARIRRPAVWTLGRMGAIGDAPAIAALLKDPDLDVQQEAMKALALVDAEAHAKEIVPFLSYPDPIVRAVAIRVFSRLDLKEAIRRATPRLSDLNDDRREAWEPFQRPEARDHAGTIVPLLKHGDSQLRDRAVTTLGHMGASDHAPAMAALLEDPDEFVRTSAGRALGRLVLPKDRIDPAWIRKIRGFEWQTTWEVFLGLLRVGGKSREEQRQFTEAMLMMSNESPVYYTELLQGLGEVNEPAAAAVLVRRFKLEKPVATWADLEALFEARGLKLKGAPGLDIFGRTAAGRDVSLQDLITRHFDQYWHAVPEKDVVQLLWSDKAMDYWIRRLK